MELLKVVLIVISLTLLLVSALVWLAGLASKSDARKKLGIKMLGVWLIFDFICLILALCFGWFKA